MGISLVDDMGFGEEIYSQVRRVTKLSSAAVRDDVLCK